MQYFVYIIYSPSSDRYYIGSTADIKDRLYKHNNIHKGYTAQGRPWRLVYYESFDNKTEGIRRERQLKSWKNRERIQRLIDLHRPGSEPPD